MLIDMYCKYNLLLLKVSWITMVVHFDFIL